MENCINCKFWAIASQYVRKQDGKHVLHGPCFRTQGFDFEPDASGIGSKAFAMPFSSKGTAAAILYADEDFGCVEFIARDGSAIADRGISEDALAFARKRRTELEPVPCVEVSV